MSSKESKDCGCTRASKGPTKVTELKSKEEKSHKVTGKDKKKLLEDKEDLSDTLIIGEEETKKSDEGSSSESEEECGQRYLKLRLTYTITEDLSVYYDTGVPNGDGSLVWVVVSKTAGNPGDDAARLYANNNGTLVLLSTVYLEAPYLAVAGGSISEDGRLAYVAEESLDGTVGRIRVFAIPSMSVSVIPFTNINDVNLFLTASTQILENRYTAVSYGILDGNTDAVTLVDLATLTVIDSTAILALSNEGGWVFRLGTGCKLYVSVPNSTYDPVSGDFVGPVYYQIFKLKKGKLVEVKSARLVLPSDIGFHSVRIKDGIAIISIGTGYANIPGVPPIGGVGDQPTIVNPTGEPSGLRILKFNGCNICVASLAISNSGTTGYVYTTLSPDAKDVIAGVNQFVNSTNAVAIFEAITFHLHDGPSCNLGLITSAPVCCKKDQYELVRTDNNYLVQSPVNYSFSADGKWLVVGGGTFGVPNNTYPNVAVFRVYYSDCQ